MENSRNYGVYISVRTVDGKLWSSNRETVAEVKEDWDNAQEFLGTFFGGSLGEAEAVANVVQAFPTATAPQASAPTPAAPSASAPSQDSFETCPKCGSLKDKWVPPGTSKRTGKPYPGFYGCSNPSCR